MVDSIKTLIPGIPADVRDRVRECPAEFEEKLEARDALLVGQIQQFVQTRTQELVHYATSLVQEYEHEQARAKKERSDSNVAATRPRLKSIVKRRPSLIEKKVTFSTAPPQVENIDDSDANMSDTSESTNTSDNGSDGDPPPEGGNAIVLFKHREGMPEMKAGKDFKLTMRKVPDEREAAGAARARPKSETHNDKRTRTARNGVPIASDKSEDKDRYTHKGQNTNVSEPQFHTSQRDSTGATAGDTSNHNDRADGPTFSFDDIMEPDNESRETSARTPGLVSSGDTSPPVETAQPARRTSDLDNPISGSVPVNINLPAHMSLSHGGLCGDGGLRSVDRLDPRVIETGEDLEPSPPSESPSPPITSSEMDPSNMSFSQRMAWEDRDRQQ